MSKYRGWLRLFLVTLIVTTIVATYFSLAQKDLSGDGNPPAACVFGTSEDDYRSYNKFVDNRDYADPPLDWEQWTKLHGEPQGAMDSVMSVSRFENQTLRRVDQTITVKIHRCSSWTHMFKNLAIALAVSLLTVFAGMAAAWVVKGFRAQNAQKN